MKVFCIQFGPIWCSKAFLNCQVISMAKGGCIIFLLASTYFYSGLCKLNEGFLHTVWTDMVLKGFFKLPGYFYGQRWVYYSGYLAGITELLPGIGLLFKKTQRLSARVLIAMHLFVLLLLGPIGFSGYQV